MEWCLYGMAKLKNVRCIFVDGGRGKWKFLNVNGKEWMNSCLRI